jgi:male-specific lethal 1
METDEPYFTIQNEVLSASAKSDIESEKAAEVPGFRLKPLAASYIMEGTENIEDETLLKRHQKPEADEKRRKRWDVQRLREQRHVERLRARYDPNDDHLNVVKPSTSKAAKSKIKPPAEIAKVSLDLKSLNPNPEEATEIVVQEFIPVSAFGCVLPKFGIEEFSLPWLN